ncbi:FAD dependent oxidoreductase [Phyllosticta capitalensis]|uniref:FAD dependent oxidoreductase n=1 Tax=Phyllosticta capitalensis TaxID=121624 RepID=A0ABR1Z562_9PEZI
MASPANTVIVGAGIIGISTAYYLSQSESCDPKTIHIIEPSLELFCSASGLAGGFLAEDWFAPSVAPLGALSFRLHRELADQFDGRKKWGFCVSTGTSLSHDPDDTEEAVLGSGEDWLSNGTSRAEAAGAHEFKEGEGPAWLIRKTGSSLEVISKGGSTAQIDPKRLCEFLLEQCRARGVQLHHPAHATAVTTDSAAKLAGVRIKNADGSEHELPCARLVVTAGAWTPRVFSTLFPRAQLRIPISALGGHSLLLRSPRWTEKDEGQGCHAVFATDTLGFSPELFSRIGEELYIAGLNTTQVPLPELASDVTISEKAVKQLEEVAATMCGLPEKPNDLTILRKGLCFRPVTSSGRPIISRVPDAKLGVRTNGGGEGGVFLAAGHGAWGITQSLGTGLVLSELLRGQPTSANIKALALPV